MVAKFNTIYFDHKWYVSVKIKSSCEWYIKGFQVQGLDEEEPDMVELFDTENNRVQNLAWNLSKQVQKYCKENNIQ